MSLESNPARSNLLLVLLLVHMAASLWHHIHNGQFLDEYPNMPRGVPPVFAYIAWIVTSAVGLAGYYWVCNGRRLLGFGAMGLYAAYGLGALGHYMFAPMSAHTFVMNATILSEALTGALLLGTVMVFLVKDKDL